MDVIDERDRSMGVIDRWDRWADRSMDVIDDSIDGSLNFSIHGQQPIYGDRLMKAPYNYGAPNAPKFIKFIRMVPQCHSHGCTTSSTVFDNRGLSFFNRIDRFLHS